VKYIDGLIKASAVGVFLCVLALGMLFAPPPKPASAYTVYLELKGETGSDAPMRFCVSWKDPFGKKHYTCTPWMGKE